MQCVKPFRLTPTADFPRGLKVPCGKCLMCKIKRRSEATLRIMHELETFRNNACFVTLTYDNDHVPFSFAGDRSSKITMSLRKEDLQLFFKRFRKDFTGSKIKYYACGEYGDEGERPHYHFILLGMSPNAITELYIEKNWNQGIVDVAYAEYDSIRYVAQYIDKKFTGELCDTEYRNRGREDVFKTQSQGLGLAWALGHEDEILDKMYLTQRGVKVTIPRYYINKLGIDLDLHREKINDKERQLNEKIIEHCATDDELQELNELKILDSNTYYDMMLKKHAVVMQKHLDLHVKMNMKKRGKL